VNAPNVTSGDPGAWHAAYIMDSKYTRERAVLVKDLEARLAALPPESRAKVMSSLQAINDSKRDLEAELGKDPSNALLQELLVNTYQDEMRVLAAVHEAGRAVEGT
jgi:phage-related protein